MGTVVSPDPSAGGLGRRERLPNSPINAQVLLGAPQLESKRSASDTRHRGRPPTHGTAVGLRHTTPRSASDTRHRGRLRLPPCYRSGRAQAELGASSGSGRARGELRLSSGRAQAELRLSSGRARAELSLRPSSGRAQAELGGEPRPSSGRAQAELGASLGRAQSQ